MPLAVGGGIVSLRIARALSRLVSDREPVRRAEICATGQEVICARQRVHVVPRHAARAVAVKQLCVR